MAATLSINYILCIIYTSIRRLAKGSKTVVTLFIFLIAYIIITPLIGVLKIAPHI